MAETIRYSLVEESRLIYSSITEMSTPKGVMNAKPKYSGTFGIGKVDFDAIVQIMVDAIKSELGSFSGNPNDYYLACSSGITAGKRAIATAEFKGQGLPADEQMKLMEKAQARAELYKPYPGILVVSSQFTIELAKLENGKIIDIPDEQIARAKAGKDLFYPGAFVAPAVAFKPFRRKTMEAKDGVTGYLQNCLFLRKGERIAGSGGPSNNEVFGNFAGYSSHDPTAGAPSNSDMAMEDDVAF